MRKYFTWRCIGLHTLVLVLVPAFLFAGWWQYHVAMSGNELGWVYTVQWPFLAVYAVYMWWKLIHDQSTPFDRFWAAKQRVAADASGRPLYEIPGWATDKALSREVYQASLEASRLPALSRTPADALGGEAAAEQAALATRSVEDREDADLHGAVESVIDARVLEEKVVVDEELDAYNRYLADLAWRDPPKRWSPTRHSHRDAPGTRGDQSDARVEPRARHRSELPSGADPNRPDGDVGVSGDP
ncbi:MAG: hypothetical protein ACRD0J_16790 [Acidimicrobiales bacterium]